MTRAFVIGRRRKGRRIGGAVRDARRSLEAAGWKVDSGLVRRKRDLTSQAKTAVKRGCEVLVVVGGDGAILRVAPALATTTVALGVVPAGTGNLLATNLRIPHDPAKAIDTILTGQRRAIDLGHACVDGKTFDFSIACGIGFDAAVMDATDASRKRRWGKLAYLAGALTQTDALDNVRVDITIDGKRMRTEGAQVFVANCGRMSVGVRPRLAIRPDDGLLDVILVRASGPIGGLLAGWEALRQKDLGESARGHVLRAQAKEVRIETMPARLVEVDGSVVGRTPIEASVMPSALTVLVPAS